jgi:hypothetical protein
MSLADRHGEGVRVNPGIRICHYLQRSMRCLKHEEISLPDVQLFCGLRVDLNP